jgi:VanZ family protein
MPPFVRHPALSWILLASYSLLIFIQSSLPSIDMGTDLPGMDKLLHLAAYTLMGVLACRAFASLSRLESALALFMAGFAFTLLFGLSDEWHQSFVPGRTADVWDFVADALGALLGAGITCRHLRPGGSRGPTFPR